MPKNSVRKNLAEQLPKAPVLLDWKGKVHPSLGFPAGAVISVGVFGASGELLGMVTGEQTQSRVSEVIALLAR